jgi:hypothetical protein
VQIFFVFSFLFLFLFFFIGWIILHLLTFGSSTMWLDGFESPSDLLRVPSNRRLIAKYITNKLYHLSWIQCDTSLFILSCTNKGCLSLGCMCALSYVEKYELICNSNFGHVSRVNDLWQQWTGRWKSF